MSSISNIVPILYIEEVDPISPDGNDWKVFIRYAGNGKFVVHGTRRGETKHLQFAYHRLEFLTLASLTMWLREAMDNFTEGINVTMFTVDRDALISHDYVGYENLRLSRNELYGYDNVKADSQFIIRQLRILRDLRA